MSGIGLLAALNAHPWYSLSVTEILHLPDGGGGIWSNLRPHQEQHLKTKMKATREHFKAGCNAAGVAANVIINSACGGSSVS